MVALLDATAPAFNTPTKGRVRGMGVGGGGDCLILGSSKCSVLCCLCSHSQWGHCHGKFTFIWGNDKQEVQRVGKGPQSGSAKWLTMTFIL